MATVEFRYDPKNTAWFTANAAMILKAGEPAYHDTTGLFKLGDGVTALSALSFLPIVSTATPTIQQVLTAGQVATTTVETTGFIKTGGTSSQFLKADGSVDSSTYLTTLGTAATSLTTTGSNGAATLIANVLNVPNYTLAGLGGTTLAAVNAQNLSVFAATTSSQLAGVISDETGSGALVFGTSPTFTTSIITPNVTGVSGNLTLTNSIQSSGAITQFTFTAAANTNQTATTNIPNFRISGTNKQWATGTVANQYWNYLTANTASFVGASTLSESVALQINAATAGTNATITNNFSLGLLAGTATVKIGNLNGSTTNAAVYMNQATPSGTNYTLRVDTAGNTLLNGSQIFLCVGGTSQLVMNNNSFSFQSLVAATTGAVTTYTFNSPNHSGQTASTEIVGQSFNTYTRNWLQGNITNQREMYLRTVNYAFSNTSTITNAYRLYIEPAANGGNAIITNNFALGLAGSLKINDTFNIVFDTTTGTKIGTATTQKIGFWNATPIVQPTTAVAAAAFVANTSGIANDTATFDGYTIGQIVKALRNTGLLA